MGALSFLQSSEWEAFQNSLGRKTWRLGKVLLVEHDLPSNFSYLYCPRPGALDENFFENVQEIARERNSIFLKIDPTRSLKGQNFRVAPSLQPQKTILLDLQKEEKDLLASMHEKTRYNVRLAERKGVQVKNLKEYTSSDFEVFWKLLCETAGRDGFHTHEKTHYEKLLAVKTADFSNEIFFAEYSGKIIAAAIINFYIPSGRATYLHGASTRAEKQIMAPNLLHWSIIMKAKARGLSYYDFGGIDPSRWPGVTRFKLGFGGEIAEFPRASDLVYRPILYQFYLLAKKLKK